MKTILAAPSPVGPFYNHNRIATYVFTFPFTSCHADEDLYPSWSVFLFLFHDVP